MLAPTRELAQQIEDEADEVRRTAAARPASTLRRRASLGPQIGIPRAGGRRPPRALVLGRCKTCSSSSCLAGDEPRPLRLPRARRGRPDARHGVRAADQDDRRQDARRAPDPPSSRRRGRRRCARWRRPPGGPTRSRSRSAGSGQKLVANKDVAQSFVLVDGGEAGKPEVFAKVVADECGASDSKVIVFCNTKLGCEKLAFAQRRSGSGAVAIHGDKDQWERERAARAVHRRPRVDASSAPPCTCSVSDARDQLRPAERRRRHRVVRHRGPAAPVEGAREVRDRPQGRRRPRRPSSATPPSPSPTSSPRPGAAGGGRRHRVAAARGKKRRGPTVEHGRLIPDAEAVPASARPSPSS